GLASARCGDREKVGMNRPIAGVGLPGGHKQVKRGTLPGAEVDGRHVGEEGGESEVEGGSSKTWANGSGPSRLLSESMKQQ
ncbi:MAG: hypothetical protein ACI8V4_000389, partial [Ilumatobacter sp.]